jgi:hypothetical protein
MKAFTNFPGCTESQFLSASFGPIVNISDPGEVVVMILFSSALPQWESDQFSQAWEHGVFTIIYI